MEREREHRGKEGVRETPPLHSLCHCSLQGWCAMEVGGLGSEALSVFDLHTTVPTRSQDRLWICRFSSLAPWRS